MEGERFKYYALKMSALTVLIFGIQLLFNNYGFTDALILTENSFYQPWRFITSIFLHGGLLHLVYNLFALIMFGSFLEKFVGGKKFLVVFFVSGLFANLISVNFYDASLGASGAIFGVIGALVIIRPTLPVWAFGMPMPIFIAGILWVLGDILGAVGFLIGNPIDNTGNIAHLSGMLIGFIFGAFDRQKLKSKRKKVNVSIDEHKIRQWEDTYMR